MKHSAKKIEQNKNTFVFIEKYFHVNQIFRMSFKMK